MYYAQITGGIVTAITETSGPIDSADMVLIEALDASLLGQTYDNGAFAQPASVAARRHITLLAFISRFTDAEAVGIDLASIGNTPEAAGMRRFQNKVNAAKFIDLDHPDARGGVQTLEAVGLLGVGRALAILDAPITDEEKV